MKKIKIFSVVSAIVMLALLFTGCTLFNFNTNNNNTESLNTFAEGTYILTSIYEKHEEPCDYLVTQNDSIPFGFMFMGYQGTTITFQSLDENSGTFNIALSDLAQTNDVYFNILSGNYLLENGKVKLSNNQEEMTAIVADETISFVVSEYLSEVEGHEGHNSKLVFVFELEI